MSDRRNISDCHVFIIKVLIVLAQVHVLAQLKDQSFGFLAALLVTKGLACLRTVQLSHLLDLLHEPQHALGLLFYFIIFVFPVVGCASGTHHQHLLQSWVFFLYDRYRRSNGLFLFRDLLGLRNLRRLVGTCLAWLDFGRRRSWLLLLL